MLFFLALALATSNGDAAILDAGSFSQGQSGIHAYEAEHTAGAIVLIQKNMQIYNSSASSSLGQSSALDMVQATRDFRESLREVDVAATNPSSKLLILILSCHKHSDQWDSLLTWGRRVHPEGDMLILAGRPQNRTLQQPYELSLATHTLIVNSSDSYDGLAVKMMMAYNSINSAPELSSVTHVFKIDDTVVAEGANQVFAIDGFNGTLLQSSLAADPGDYITSEFGYNVYDCPSRPLSDMEWHFGRVPTTSFWHNRRQPCNWSFTYANGEFGYLLSRRSLNLISNHWPLDSMETLYHEFVYEDMAVGVTLMEEGVKPLPTHLSGMEPWNAHSCPCTSTSVNGGCDSYCQAHMSQGHTRCCFQACRDNLGLCDDVKYVG